MLSGEASDRQCRLGDPPVVNVLPHKFADSDGHRRTVFLYGRAALQTVCRVRREHEQRFGHWICGKINAATKTIHR